MPTTLLIRQDALDQTRLQTLPDAALAAGQIRVRIGPFALTSNNLTYAALGQSLRYWEFFPSGEAGWGIVPAWGFATVVQSALAGVVVGERLYGLWPMADQVVLQPQRLRPDSFVDAAPHRVPLHPVYNHYSRCAPDPLYTAGSEDLQALLRPLFITSWLIDDFLADQGFFGAGTVLLSSASSKTAFGCAFQLAQRAGLTVVGLTSPANMAFCTSLGCYDRVLAYDALDALPAETACVYVDFSGNSALRQAVHARFAQLRHSCTVGATHLAQLGTDVQLPGPPAVPFFAPAQIRKRTQDWGRQGFNARQAQAWQALLVRVGDPVRPWLVPQHHQGAAATQALYLQLLAGAGDPRSGHMVSMATA